MKQEINMQTSTRKPRMVAPLLDDGICAAGKRRIMIDILGKRGGCYG